MRISPIGAAYAPPPVAPIVPASHNAVAIRTASGMGPGDQNASILAGIAGADAAKLTAILDPPQAADVTARVRQLVQDGASAIAQGNVAAVTDDLKQIAALDPHALETLRTEPAWASARPEIEHLMSGITAVAKLEAEASLGRAAQVLETGAGKMLPNWQTRTDALLTAAHRVFDAGGYANYVRSNWLALAIVDSSLLTPYFRARISGGRAQDSLTKAALQRNIDKNWTRLRKRVQARAGVLWTRAPLLILLLAWFALGLIAGIGSMALRNIWPENWPRSLFDNFFDVWALGLLALVGFGLWARIRKLRF